ncbi:MAG: hypothetical protein LC793_23830, partial [Thermomicrobia bacterium]|nr:hypothetical protein [Thermomicrobia bacterium]
MDCAQDESERDATFAPFLAGGAVGLALGLVVGSVVGSLFARSIGAAVRSLRRRLGTDDEPHFEFL